MDGGRDAEGRGEAGLSGGLAAAVGGAARPEGGGLDEEGGGVEEVVVAAVVGHEEGHDLVGAHGVLGGLGLLEGTPQRMTWLGRRS